jgi:DNA-binding XRE family transcriptional regulator
VQNATPRDRAYASGETLPGPRRLSHFARVRVNAGHTQSSLGERSGFSRGLIAACDAGHVPRLDTAVRVADALGCPVGVLWPTLIDSDPRGRA